MFRLQWLEMLFSNARVTLTDLKSCPLGAAKPIEVC